MGPENRNMEFWYRDELVSIPHATAFDQIKPLVANRVLPGLNVLEASHPMAVEYGLGFVPYLYKADSWSLDSPPAMAIREVIEEMGFKVDTSRTRKRQPIFPSRGDLISVMRGNDSVYPMSFFMSTSFVIGPLAVYETDGFRTPSFLVTNQSVIVDGPALLGGNTSIKLEPSPERESEISYDTEKGFSGYVGDTSPRITEDQIVKILEDIFDPYKI